MQKPSETEILEGINAKDREALRQLFEMYYAALKFFAIELINKDLVEEEIMENTFLRLQTESHYFETFASLQTFLYDSVLKSCLERVRQHPTRFNLLIEKSINQNAGKYIIHTEYVRLKYLQLQKA